MRRRLVPGLVVALMAAGCGVTVESDPRGVTPPPGPFAGLASPAPATPTTAVSGAVDQVLYFVRGGKLASVTRHVGVPPSIDDVIAALRTGPTQAEHDTGLTTALGGINVIASVTVTGDQAELALASPVEGTGRADEALAYAQLVCSLTARPDIHSVVFTRDGQPVGVPRGDGSLSEGPLTAADYRMLLGG